VQLLDAAMTGLYIITATLPLALVVFAFSRHRQLDAAPRVVAVFAFVSGMIQVISNVAPQGSRYTHWTLADKITGPLFAINGNSVNLVSLAGILLLISIVFAVYRNSLDARRRQIALEQEFRDARELQQVLIPETPKTLPGFEITSSYLPAAEVGGDFLQLIPAVRDHEGATLAVIGDVSGKGLRAAMSVALIVGAVRTLAESTSRPAEILDGLNRRLCGRMQGGFVTCLIMRLHPDGSCVLANAGHPPPFINDREMELSGALPLGLISEISYNEIRFRLEENDRLTLYTDGLLEARNRAGEIYGFARMQTLLKTRPTAAQAAQAAVDFGQDDDTTVLTLTRL
jgi:serine phosphatase RsbU (regulator of sigma subunit)